MRKSGKEKAMEGNQMKIREALVKVLRLANVTADGENWDWNNAIAENVVKVVKEALAAPPRNCDLPKPEERFTEFCSRYLSCSSCPHRGPGDLRCDGKWLLAPAENGGAE